MDSVEEAYAAVRRGDIATGLQLMNGASEAGNPEASFELGLWLFHGQLVARDLRRAGVLFKRAAEGGDGRRHRSTCRCLPTVSVGIATGPRLSGYSSNSPKKAIAQLRISWPCFQRWLSTIWETR